KAETTLSAGTDYIANEFYEVRFDRSSGAVRSIVEQPSGRELVDTKTPQLLNQLVYVHKDAREAQSGFNYSPPRARKQESLAGQFAAEFRVWIDDEKTG